MPSLEDLAIRAVLLIVALVVAARMLAWLLDRYSLVLCLLALFIIIGRLVWFYTRR